VTSYVVKDIDPARIKPILQVAIARFEEHQTLRHDLADAQSQLAQRKVIERAKGIVMKQKGIGEDEAYRLLRKLAMDRNAKLADVQDKLLISPRLSLNKLARRLLNYINAAQRRAAADTQ